MYLKSIELQGFKSFAERTKIEFNHSVTGIVGPNGSGKSNISDAVMWALGEQSVKSLRGAKMEDVIFSGTKKRKPLGFAYVSLTFDNKDGWLPLDYQEVTVSRKMYRSGESEFKINQKSCRLKDIKELFMDTGIGKDGYSLIGQGKIESVLSTKPEDRRSIFEEAAGISKYKVKKEEAERKLKRTLENIQRIDDILSEIRRQEERLGLEAKRFEEERHLFHFIREGEWKLLGDFYFGLQDKTKDLENLERKEVLALESLEKTFQELTEELRLKKAEIGSMRETLEMSREELYGKKNFVKEKEFRLRHLEERLKELHRIKDSVILEERSIHTALERRREEDEKLQQKKSDLEKFLEDFSKDAKDFSARMEILKEEVLSSNKKMESFFQEKEILNQEIRELEKRVSTVTAMGEEKSERILSLEEYVKKIDEVLDTIREELRKIAGSLKEHEEFLLEKRRKHSASLEELNELEEVLFQEQELLRNMENRKFQREKSYSFYKNAMENLEGFQKSVRSFLNVCKRESLYQDELIGPVAHLFQVKPELETAVAVGLGGSLQNIVIRDVKNSEGMIRLLKDRKLGRVTFLPLGTYEKKYRKLTVSPPPESMGFLVEEIHCEPRLLPIFRGLLTDTLLAGDYPTGLKIMEKYRVRRIITLEGEILHSSGSITGGSVYQGNTDMVNRKRRLEEDRLAIEKLTYEIKDRQERLDILSKNLNQKREELKKLSEEIQILESEEIQLKEKRAALKVSLESNLSHKEKYQEEYESLVRNLEEDKDGLKNMENELELLLNQVHGIEEKERKLSEILVGKNEDFENLRERTIAQNLAKKEKEGELATLKLEEEHGAAEEARLKARLSNLAEERCKGTQEKEDRLKEKEALEKSLSSLSEDLAELFKKSEEYQNRLALMEEEINQGEENRDVLEEKVRSSEEKLRKLSFNREKLDLEWNHRRQSYVERYGEPDFSEFGPLEPRTKITLEKEIKKAKKERESIGTVNSSAPEEYQEAKKRLDFHERQRNDLQEGEESLRRIITKLDREMRDLFQESFEEISKYFDEIFKILFHGGKATILMEEGNLLEAGIEIKSQPPGKKFQSLSLLSGGERALTAVALLFALLKKRPAPFCILDEIDAALDDSNINRYINYLGTLENIQFIMITHRKPTMEIADILYGVTMEEMGVSKIVPMELDGYKEELHA